MWLVVLSHIAGLFSFALLFHLFLYFPQPSAWLRRWPRLTTWLYLPLCLFVLPSFGVGRLPAQYSTPIFRWPPMRWLMGHGLLTGRLRHNPGLPGRSAGLSVAQLSDKRYQRPEAAARDPVGKPDRVWQPISDHRHGGDRHAREVRNILGLAAIFDALYTAARSAQFRLRDCPPSSHTDQPDYSPRRALRAGLARVGPAGTPLCGSHCRRDARSRVQACASVGADHWARICRCRYRRLAGSALAASPLSRTGD